MVELDSGSKLVHLRCDNAKEYIKFQKVIEAEGICVEYTSPYTPEQNGVAERYNRTIIQIVRAMLIGAKLPQSFWAEAAKTANYLRNLLPSGHDNQPPDELWSNKTSSVMHLKTFGCMVHVHIPKEKQAKLDKVSYQGIFLGYHSTCQFRVFNPQTRKVEWPTAVKFLEYIPGGQLLKRDSKENQPIEVDASINFSDDNETDPGPQSQHFDVEFDVPERVGESGKPGSIQKHANIDNLPGV